jgi:hypothetical protein
MHVFLVFKEQRFIFICAALRLHFYIVLTTAEPLIILWDEFLYPLLIMRWAWHVARMMESRGVYRVLVGRPEEKRPLGSPRRRWEDNIKIDLREVGCEGMDWIDLAQVRDR